MGKMPFRQIHLDFHTGEAVPNVGKEFKKEQFQAMLKKGHVNAINIFAKCHHGWLYYQNGVTPAHPTLEFNLLDEMLEACSEIDVETQIYISAGLDERIAKLHPEWLYRSGDQSLSWAKSFLNPGYHLLCFNTPYLDYLIAQVEEVTRKYETKGIWLDITKPEKCYCQTCCNQLISEGKDPRNDKDVEELGERVFMNYMEKVNEAIKRIKPDMQIFHNSGHIYKGCSEYYDYYTHYELESLPTGGWGYDHFPLSARYVQGLGKEFLGMTGKFHMTWGEFGGYKHPNALRYEAALNIANGGKMCIGDQMHPLGFLDEVTYSLIGEAYKEIEEKEPWCDDVSNVADVAVLSSESIKNYYGDERGVRSDKGDTGISRMLLEGHYLFDVVSAVGDFNPYKVIILPDQIRLDDNLTSKLKAYTAQGGQVLATGESGLKLSEDDFALAFGADCVGVNKYKPDYFVPEFNYHGLGNTAFVMYGDSMEIKVTDGEVLGHRQDSYFNRDMLHFCSHRHTPNNPESQSAAIVRGRDGVYIPWKVFADYADQGSLILKDMVKYVLDIMLENNKSLVTTLPAQGVTTLQHQEEASRLVHHLLYGVPVKRGQSTEVIEDIVPLYGIENEIHTDKDIKKVYLAPSGEEIAFEKTTTGIRYTLDKLEFHQMVVLDY